MAYCAVADIQKYYRKIVFSGTSDITNTDVDAFITNADAEIDATLQKFYVTPITGTESLKLMKLISEKLVVGEVDRVLREGKAKIDEKENYVDFKKEGHDLLKDILKGNIKLIDAKYIGSGVSDYFSSSGVTNEVQFEKDTEQW